MCVRACGAACMSAQLMYERGSKSSSALAQPWFGRMTRRAQYSIRRTMHCGMPMPHGILLSCGRCHVLARAVLVCTPSERMLTAGPALACEALAAQRTYIRANGTCVRACVCVCVCVCVLVCVLAWVGVCVFGR